MQGEVKKDVLRKLLMLASVWRYLVPKAQEELKREALVDFTPFRISRQPDSRAAALQLLDRLEREYPLPPVTEELCWDIHFEPEEYTAFFALMEKTVRRLRCELQQAAEQNAAAENWPELLQDTLLEAAGSCSFILASMVGRDLMLEMQYTGAIHRAAERIHALNSALSSPDRGLGLFQLCLVDLQRFSRYVEVLALAPRLPSSQLERFMESQFEEEVTAGTASPKMKAQLFELWRGDYLNQFELFAVLLQVFAENMQRAGYLAAQG